MRKKLTEENPKLAAEWDYEKNQGLMPDDFTGGSDRRVWWRCKHGHSWQTQIKCRLKTGCPYCAGKKVWVGFNDLQTTNPRLAAEWDNEKNMGRKPTEFTAASNKSAWWKCALGHTWYAMINNRNCGQGCPYCAGRKVLSGFNDLVTTHPEIAAEWDYSKNVRLTPEQVTLGSKIKIWWKCEHGHSWRAAVYSRKIHDCPHCYGNILTIGVNDLQTVNPQLAAEWDYAKNGRNPDNVAANSAHKAWWLCQIGHSWQAAIRNRNHGNGCPYCANRFALKGFNDLLTIDPELCKEWDCFKNDLLQPDEVTADSGEKAWWVCAKGHSWTARIADRRRGAGCPVCAGKIIIPGENDLATLRPEIAAGWDYTKNGSLLPEHVPCQSTRKVWWLCERGHSYLAIIYNRYYGTNCPYCAGNLPIVGETDLATKYPKSLAEWDYEKNYPMRPEDYSAYSNQKVWWKCIKGHRWEALIYDRYNGCNCPYCAGKTPMRTRLVK